nr:hypothetical protein [Ereboglobus luteus]
MNQKTENPDEGGNEAVGKALSGGVIRVDESMIKGHLDKVVLSTVEQTLCKQALRTDPVADTRN